MTLDQRIALGQHAARLLGDPLFVDAVLAASDWYKDQTFRTSISALDKREELYAEYKGLQRVMERLQAWKSDGMIAETDRS